MQKLLRAAVPVISYFELSERWQAEARSNLGEFAEEAFYLEPEASDEPSKHILFDLFECIDGVIPGCNTYAYKVIFDANHEYCDLYVIS